MKSFEKFYIIFSWIFPNFFVNLCNNSIYVKISPRLFFLLLKFPEDLKQDKYQYWFKTIKNINSNISGN